MPPVLVRAVCLVCAMIIVLCWWYGVVFYDLGFMAVQSERGWGEGTRKRDGQGWTNKVPISVRIRHNERPKKREKRVVTARGFKIGPNRISLAETNEF